MDPHDDDPKIGINDVFSTRKPKDAKVRRFSLPRSGRAG
jgi:hypothetical protein